MKILYVARDLGTVKNGANQVMMRNLNCLRTIAGEDNVKVFHLPKASLRNVMGSFARLGSYGVPKKLESELKTTVRDLHPDVVFIESSSNGSLFKILKSEKCVTVCFAHNVDTILAKQEIQSRNPIISLPKYLLTSYNEKVTVKYADKIICLNDRDSKNFKQMFDREGDVILPITFPNRKIDLESTSTNENKSFLFVGSDFFPNVEGIKWFIENVAPKVTANFRIVGACCGNSQLTSLQLPDNVKLIGYADDLDQEYADATGVIAPIFKGSGMKTKTIEALSYGKFIYGTSEAFEGIKDGVWCPEKY
jgi:glycosyltransferase involved in cell wall biosynthesis